MRLDAIRRCGQRTALRCRSGSSHADRNDVLASRQSASARQIRKECAGNRRQREVDGGRSNLTGAAFNRDGCRIAASQRIRIHRDFPRKYIWLLWHVNSLSQSMHCRSFCILPLRVLAFRERFLIRKATRVAAPIPDEYSVFPCERRPRLGLGSLRTQTVRKPEKWAAPL